MKKIPWALFAALCGLAFPQWAGASGSARVVVIERSCSVELRQTFRKIMRGSQMGRYFARARRRFLTRAGGVAPALVRFVATKARKKIPSLRAWDFSWPVHECKRLPCSRLKRARFPAVVQLTWLKSAHSSRRAVAVGLPFQTRPTPAQLRWLRTSLLAILARVGGAKKPGMRWFALKQVQHKDRSFVLANRSYAFVRKPLVAWAKTQRQAQLARLAKKLKTYLAKAKGLKLMRWRTGLPFYEWGKTPSGRLSLYADLSHTRLRLNLAVAKIADLKRFQDLHSGLTRRLERP